MAQHIWTNALTEAIEKIDDWIDGLAGEGDKFKPVLHKLQEARGPLGSALLAAQDVENVPENERY